MCIHPGIRHAARFHSLILLTLLASAALGQSSGGSFQLTQSVVAGGGDQSSGSGNLIVTGTAGQPGAGTPLSNGSFSQTGGFWAGTLATPLPATITGQLMYANGGTPAINVTMTLTGPLGFTPRITTTDNNGDYSFLNVPAGGNYTVTPSKTGGINGITAFDASLAARFAAHLISLTSNQQVAADASNNGSVSAFDASLIARTAANIPNPGIAGTWKFSPASLRYSGLSADQSNQNVTAILVGDVSGNWMPAGPSPIQPSSAAAVITVSLPNKQDSPGGPSTIPITVGDGTGQGVFSYDFDIVFDHNVLQPQSTPFDAAGTLSSGWAVNANSSTPDHLAINAFNTGAMSGQGILLYLKFNVVGAAGSQTPLTWASFEFNEGDPGDSDINGQFTAAGPTAALAVISGQIVDGEGRPVSGTTITVTGGPKLIRAITDSNGYYKVENLETGGFYRVTPSRANFVFGPANRSFSLIADKTDAVFTAIAVGPNANPLDSPEFFVRQQYVDFLGREPDQDGLDYWSAQLRACASDLACINARRIGVSAAFFIEQEFQETGSFVYRMYKASLGRQPSYAEFCADRSRVVGGATLTEKQQAFADEWVSRDAFKQQYPDTMTASEFVNKLFDTASLQAFDQRQQQIDAMTNDGRTRAAVLRDSIEITEFKTRQYNRSFVLMQYFGYLHRDPDQNGYDFWLNVLNNREPGNYRGMVCAFITVLEYQERFGSIHSHSNSDCAP